MSAESRPVEMGRRARSLWDRVKARATRFMDEELDADKLLRKTMIGLIELAAARYPVSPGEEWAPGKALELLLVGYSGTRNTGADVRVEEMIRQFRHLLGDRDLRLSILTLDPEKTRGYFKGVRQILSPQVFPKFLFDTVHQHHGVVACEGSMFKSKFANALTTFMVGALGLAQAERKIAVGYGGEAGDMDPEVEDMVRTYCAKAQVIARNKASIEILNGLGIESSLGADTAWTFEPDGPEVAHALLKGAGWDGKKPVVIACPINAFWWPVQADLKRGVEQFLFKNHARDHYRSVYFHAGGDEITRKQKAYEEAFVGALLKAEREHGAFVVLVGMEALDRKAAEAIAKRLRQEGSNPPLFISDEYEHHKLVSLLRVATALITSRYHAIVCSMPAAIPAVGVTMDERIRNVLGDAGLADFSLEVDDPELPERMKTQLAEIFRDDKPIREALRKETARQLFWMGRMGQTFVEAIRRRHPEFPLRDAVGYGHDPLSHLPPLSEGLQTLLTDHADWVESLRKENPDPVEAEKGQAG